MKKLVLGTLAALIMAPLVASAQSENFASRPSTERTHSVSLSIPLGTSLHYGYEIPLGRLGSIVGRVGAEAGGSWGYNMLFGNYGWWAVAPSIDVEPRYYYGLDRREAHGRSTYGNAGSFLAFQVKNTMPFGYISDRGMKFTGVTVLTPMWGLRRVWGDHWLFEFTAGYSLGLGWKGVVDDSPHLGVRFGYSF